MTAEAKPGACPACGNQTPELFVTSQYVAVCCKSCGLTGGTFLNDDDGDCHGKPNAIAAWNGIRARVLREAKDLIRDDENCTDVDYAVFLLKNAAERAERGE
jgi:hypothetical protein